MEVQGEFRVVSSAPWHGGFRRARRIVNLQVPLNFDCDVGRFFRSLPGAYRRADCVGLLTAVDVRTVAVERRAGVSVVATAGISNSATVGTVNSIVVFRGRPSAAAMVEAVKVLTEAKCAALRDLDVRAGPRPATGTSTDAVVIAAEDRGAAFDYCGPATAIGRSLGLAAYRAIQLGIRRQHGLRADRPIRDRLVERGLSVEELEVAARGGRLDDAPLWESTFALDDAVLAGRLPVGPSEGYVRNRIHGITRSVAAAAVPRRPPVRT